MQSFCAHHSPHYTVQALCALEKRPIALHHAFGLRPIVAGWTWCATSSVSAAAARTATTTMHSPTHLRLRQPLRRQRCTARPRFTRPAWPRRALRSHDHQRAPRKLSVHAVALCSPCAYHAPHYTAQALRAETGACATLARSSTRITLAKRTCARLLRIMSPTILPRCHARRPRRTPHSHDCQAHRVSYACMQPPCHRLARAFKKHTSSFKNIPRFFFIKKQVSPCLSFRRASVSKRLRRNPLLYYHQSD
jgi:hypothetical protein